MADERLVQATVTLQVGPYQRIVATRYDQGADFKQPVRDAYEFEAAEAMLVRVRDAITELLNEPQRLLDFVRSMGEWPGDIRVDLGDPYG